MTQNTHDIIVFGEGGEWLSKNKPALLRRFSNPQFVGLKDWQKMAASSKAPIALIMSSPRSHRAICETLLNNSNIQKIYCEKPFQELKPLYENLPTQAQKDDLRRKISVIDHYLLKSTQATFGQKHIPLSRNYAWRLGQRYLSRWFFTPWAMVDSHPHGSLSMIGHLWVSLVTSFFRCLSILAGAVPVKYIEIDIKETKPEKRPWMWRDEELGGVVFDLGHHALALILRMFGTHDLNNLSDKDIIVKKVRFFDDDPTKSISEASFLIILPRCTLRINLAKAAINDSKKISFFKKYMTHAKASHTLSLMEGIANDQGEDGYDYAENFDQTGSCLGYDDILLINSICDRVTTIARHKESVKPAVPLNQMDLINNLTDQFKHRHSFYWQSYYKLVIYQIMILLAPYVFAMNFSPTEGSSGPTPVGLGILILTSLISIWIYYWGVKEVTASLSEEHIRLKVVHDRLKDRLTESHIDLSVTSINDSSISDVMQTQYRLLVRGLCVLNPIVIYLMYFA